MKLSKDLKEFIELLNSRKVKYVVLGGYAVAFHGHPRFTGDIDFLVEPSDENAEQLEQAIKDFGFEKNGISKDDFLQPGVLIQLGRSPNRIDLLTSASGITFDEAWANRVNAFLDGLPVSFLSRDLLIKNKETVHRPQDAADVQKLRERNPSS